MKLCKNLKKCSGFFLRYSLTMRREIRNEKICYACVASIFVKGDDVIYSNMLGIEKKKITHRKTIIWLRLSISF